MNSNLTYFYDEPATAWPDALPVGNGRLGAMVFGGTYAERIFLSDATFWSGAPSQENSNPAGPTLVPEIRRLLLNGDVAAANHLCEQIEGNKLNYGTNLPFGNLRLVMAHGDEGLRDFRRELDLESAIAAVSYHLNAATYKRETLAGRTAVGRHAFGFRPFDIAYRREIFASHPDGVLVVHITCSQPGAVSLRVFLDGDEQPHVVSVAEEATIAMDVKAREHFHSDGRTGVDGHARLVVRAQGGQVRAEGAQLVVERSNAVTLLLAFASTFDAEDPVAVCRARLEAAALMSYAELKLRHIADYQSLFRRSTLDLGPARHPDLTVDDRIAAWKRGEADPALAALHFQFGRYLLISSSRPDSPLPAHLTGIWNDNVACRMGWTCDYHLDINTQMNYWLAELTGIPECHLPLLQWIEQTLVPSGRHTARTLYDLPGWVAHIFSNPWGFTAPGWSVWWGMHPTGGAWVAAHLWDHYAFTGDRAFLKEHSYPVLKEAATFFLGYLLQDPATGLLLSGPSNSPENWYLFEGKPYAVCLAPTADNILIRALFDACIQSSRILDLDEELRAELEAARASLPPFQIGKHGQIQEWLADYDEAMPHHRHTTQLLGVFPFGQVTPERTPELVAAARVSIARRESAPGGYEEGSWARNLIMLYHARLGDGEAAYASLDTLFRVEGDRSLMMGTNIAPYNAYEMDYNTGTTAAIAEMLLQSHQGYLHLLPALPNAWPAGKVTGLCGRGGFVADIEWREGRLVKAQVRSRLGGVCHIRSNVPVSVQSRGVLVPATQVDMDTFAFATDPGEIYTLSA